MRFETQAGQVLIILVATWILVGPETVRAQTGDDALRFSERFPGISAQNTGMGGVGVAGVRDGASLILNPAGLGLVQRSSFSGSLASGNSRDQSTYEVAGFRSSSEPDVSTFSLGDLAYIYKAPTSRGSLVFSVAFHEINSWKRLLRFDGENSINSITDFFTPFSGEFEIQEDADGLFPTFSRTLSLIAFETFAIDFDQDLFDQGDSVPFLPAVRAGTVVQSSRVAESGTMREFNFGAAYEASKGVFIGASVSVPYGTYRFSRVFDEDDVFDDNNGQNGSTDFDYLTYTDGFKSEIIGINGRLGVIGYVSPTVRFGASVETPTSMSIDESFHSRLETAFDNGDQFTFGDGADDAGQGVFEYTLTTPWRFGVGAAYEGERLVTMLDLEWVDWSTMYFSSSSTDFSDENDRIEQQFQTAVSARLGVQYQINKLFLRAGFGYMGDPHVNQTGTAASPATNQERGYLSLGVGYKINEMVQADIGFIGEGYNSVYQPYNEVDGAPLVKEENTRGRLQLGLTVFFD